MTKEIVNELEINIKESENIERWITSQTKKLDEKRILGIIWQLLMLKLYIYIERDSDKTMHVVLNSNFLEQLRDLRKPIDNKSFLKMWFTYP